MSKKQISNSDGFYLTHELMIGLRKAKLLNLGMNNDLAEDMARKGAWPKNPGVQAAFWFWRIASVSILIYSVYLSFTSSWWFLIVGLILSALLNSANKRGNAENYLDAAMVDKGFYELVLSRGGWIYEIEESELKNLQNSAAGGAPNLQQSSIDIDLEKNCQIIEAYGAYIQQNPIDGVEIRDVNSLPFPKAIIIDALKKAIIHEENDQLIEIMIASGTMLAYFQKDIGQPISLLGDVSLSEMQEATMKKDANLMSSIQQRMLNNPFKDKYNSLLPLVLQEEAEIKKTLEALRIHS